MRTLISFAALFISIAFVQLGSGSLGPIDALAGTARGFSTAEIGLLGSAHFLGFFIGCWFTPILLGTVGHARAFAAFAAIGAIAALMHPVVPDPIAWALLRIGSGCAVAGAYTIAESWIQAKVDNSNRGRVTSTYRLVDMTASIAAQGVVALLDPTSYVAYNIIAAFCCFCVIPLTVTRSTPPQANAEKALRLRPMKAILLSPLGVLSVVVVGVTNASFRMVGPIYALQNGLVVQEIALFMAVGVAGGALAQWPSGWLSDKFDRRKVLIVLSTAAALVCFVISLELVSGTWWIIYASSFAFGAAAFPLYSVAVSHANDFASAEDVVELNAAMMFFYGVGAIISPLAAARLVDLFGPNSLFIYIAIAHVVLILFGLWRMTRRPISAEKTPHSYIPRTSFILGRLFGTKR
ncbi:MAG: MFS transporter [Pseudomonadota bacterium]